MELKKRIRKTGIKHTFIARKVGISDAYLSMILSEKRKPKDQTLIEKIKQAITQKN